MDLKSGRSTPALWQQYM